MYRSATSVAEVNTAPTAGTLIELEKSNISQLVFTARPSGSSFKVAVPVRRPRVMRGKRALDFLGSLTALVVISPLMVAVWALVKLTSRGPGLYWTHRVGFGGAIFLMPKFRSMYVEAPVHAREALPDASNHVTWIGGFLRRSSIDELPQLWSVLVGDMSLIGPRPLLELDATTLLRRRQYPEIFTVRPGISGLAQVNGRNHVHGHRKVRYDALYAKRWTWKMDAFILARTVRVVLSTQGVL